MGYLNNPTDKELDPEKIAIYGALGCFQDDSSFELYLKDKTLTKEKIEKKIERIFQETSGRGHGSVLDQSEFVFSISDIPRLTTFQLCLPQYLEHLQQSLRRADAKKGFYLPQEIIDSPFKEETITLLNQAFELYKKMCLNNIPEEDARYILPLYTKTNIQTKGNARELMHLHDISLREFSPGINKTTIEKIIQKTKKIAPRLMKKRNTNYEVLAWYPSAELFSNKNKTLEKLINKYGKSQTTLIGNHSIEIEESNLIQAIKKRDESELSNLKHVHYTFLAKMSLVSLHQAIRQRTWDQSVEPIYEAVKRNKIITPPSIKKSKFEKEYCELNKQIIDRYFKLIYNQINKKEAIGIIPHSLEIYDLIHINGWNALHSIGKRTCNETQWEIRNIANKIAKEIKKENPVLGKYIQPQGALYGNCPERNNCGKCDKILNLKKS